jgi:hypothetical protein
MAHQYCVKDPEIAEILVRETGELLTAQDAIGDDYAALEQLRMRLTEAVDRDHPEYLCPICGVGVYIVCKRRNEKRFFFRHQREDGSCPAITREKLTKAQIEAAKYNGVKESDAHQRMKEIIAESLRHDPDFSEVHVERVWKGTTPGEWRKPDVQALWQGRQRIVFEIQLSTTFLHVIAQRRQFYQREGALLVWVFKRFDKKAARMTQDDIFYNNNQNLFIASESTLIASKEAKALMLDCHWVEPVSDEVGGIVEQWQERRTRFAELTQDLARQRIYYFDHEGQRPALEAEAQKEGLKRRFAQWWAKSDDPGRDAVWERFQDEFATYGVRLSHFPFELRGLLTALYSAQAGRPVGYKVSKLISVAHTIAERYPEVLQVFRAALWVYARGEQLRAEDRPRKGETTGQWAKRKTQYLAEMAAGDSKYERDTRWDPLIEFLFPEVWQVVMRAR